MGHIPQMRDVMTSSPQTIDADSNLGDAEALMDRHGIRHLPVTTGEDLVGLLSDRDLKLALDPMVDFPSMRKVRDVMVDEVYVVPASEPLDNVLFRLGRAPHRLRRRRRRR